MLSMKENFKVSPFCCSIAVHERQIYAWYQRQVSKLLNSFSTKWVILHAIEAELFIKPGIKNLKNETLRNKGFVKVRAVHTISFTKRWNQDVEHFNWFWRLLAESYLKLWSYTPKGEAVNAYPAISYWNKLEADFLTWRSTYTSSKLQVTWIWKVCCQNHMLWF